MVENLQREDLNAVDKATAFQKYLSRYGGTQEELAGRLGLDRSTVSNLIRLLELPQEVLDAVRDCQITQGHARALLALPDLDGRRAACQRIIAENLSVRQTEALVATGVPTPARSRIRRDQAHTMGSKAPHLVELEERLHQRLGATVLIRVKSPDKGQIIIDYNTQEEFDRVCGLIRGNTEPVLFS
jgi:ParB family transcriptional regulator, chromosome partitioning protein